MQFSSWQYTDPFGDRVLMLKSDEGRVSILTQDEVPVLPPEKVHELAHWLLDT